MCPSKTGILVLAQSTPSKERNSTRLPLPRMGIQIITRRVLFLFSYLVHYVMWERKNPMILIKQLPWIPVTSLSFCILLLHRAWDGEMWLIVYPAHIYITSTFKHTLHTTAIIHTGSTHILTPVFHTSEYRFLGVPTHVHFSRWPRPCSWKFPE